MTIQHRDHSAENRMQKGYNTIVVAVAMSERWWWHRKKWNDRVGGKKKSNDGWWQWLLVGAAARVDCGDQVCASWKEWQYHDLGEYSGSTY